MSYTQMTIDIIKAIREVPFGFVCSYGEVAKAAGYPNGARQVVRVLSSLSSKENLAWHRIVNKKGEIALSGDGEFEQILRLEMEGVKFVKEGKVSSACFYHF
ncbi:MGMT family protein [Fusibacter bizertensis]|jgi:Predicted methylated DNA-protein cysteine methyltransferase|uniref:MGMT family protein n=1 Tax=Fusibacter bizertensis TaxID=1488331 RepID=A0ABT6N8K5_9FIRM|nr:MGMT family protein [Fusibacter bizertensis]MDH8676738.1 MGMT family protein [Fusibacter bizertensis]